LLPELTLCKLAALRLQYLEGDVIPGNWMYVSFVCFSRSHSLYIIDYPRKIQEAVTVVVGV